MLKNLLSKRKQSGFTIIEVLIVLAIAGLILVVVLVAVPQLQRNQRNESRRSVATRIVTEINNFAGNNNGDLPAPEDNGATGEPITKEWGRPDSNNEDFFGRYLGCSSPGGNDQATCTTNINDARTGQPVGQSSDGPSSAATDLTSTFLTQANPDTLGDVAGSIAYGTRLVCDGETVVAASNRNFAFQMRLEGGAIVCLDNN